MLKSKVTQGYYSLDICQGRKFFVLECGDINEELWSKSIVLNVEQGKNLIDDLRSAISELERARDEQKKNPLG